jgi:hypothetical protein
MKSLSELADVYEKWAGANEATAEGILASVDSLVDEVQEQREHAGQLMAEAAALKTRAAELRKLEGGIPEELHAVSRTADDRDHGCDRPLTIRRYIRSGKART